MRFAKESKKIGGDKWVELYKFDDYYTYSHEIRCEGKIVAVLPYRKTKDGSYEYLSRVEATPCWDGYTPIPSSLTGGVDVGHTPEFTAVKELREESGYIVEESNILFLGKSYGIKSSDTIYYLFAVEIFDDTKKVEAEDAGERGVDVCQWITENKVFYIMDPFFHVMVNKLRFLNGLKQSIY